MSKETELSKEETKGIKDILNLNKHMNWPEAERIYLKKYSKQKRLI